jgi:hypothetical protein
MPSTCSFALSLHALTQLIRNTLKVTKVSSFFFNFSHFTFFIISSHVTKLASHLTAATSITTTFIALCLLATAFAVPIN